MPDFDGIKKELQVTPRNALTRYCPSCWGVSVRVGKDFKLLWPGDDDCLQPPFTGTPYDAIQAIDNRDN